MTDGQWASAFSINCTWSFFSVLSYHTPWQTRVNASTFSILTHKQTFTHQTPHILLHAFITFSSASVGKTSSTPETMKTAERLKHFKQNNSNKHGVGSCWCGLAHNRRSLVLYPQVRHVSLDSDAKEFLAIGSKGSSKFASAMHPTGCCTACCAGG